MKTILLDSLSGTLPGGVLVADSAIVYTERDQPLFLPEFSTRWRGKLYGGVAVGRLGKSIRAKFASRYIAGFRVGIRAIPVDDGCDGSLSGLFDGAFAVGPMLDALPDGVDMAQCEKAVEAVSRVATLKTGDLLLLPLDSDEFELKPENVIEHPCIRLRVK